MNAEYKRAEEEIKLQSETTLSHISAKALRRRGSSKRIRSSGEC